MIMKNIPLWQNVKTDRYPKLKRDIETDILIIGGGITGVSTLYQLKKDKRKVVLVERNRLGYGATSRSSAKVTFLQENIYSKLLNNFNFDVSKLYYESQKEAISNLVQVCKKEKLECDLECADSYLYTLKSEEMDKIIDEQELLKSFGEIPIEVDKLPNGMDIVNGFYIKNTYVFHPLKFVNELARKSINKRHEIYENTNIINIERKNGIYHCYTDTKVIKTKHLVIATHYPNFLFPYLFPFKCHIEKSYLMAVKNKNKQFSAINISNPIYSIRYYDNYSLLIGGSHNLCLKNNYLENFHSLSKYVDSKNIVYGWSNHDIMTLDNLPYIGFVKDNIVLATGFNTWGMTNGFLAGSIVADLLNKNENAYRYLFDPKRGISKDKIVNYPVNIFSNTYSFINSKINLHKAWYKNNPYFTKFDEKEVAIYRDDKGVEHVVYTKCPHLKCNLTFNEVENTWDCPCHGSRFNLDGKCIMGPSNYDIGYKR